MIPTYQIENLTGGLDAMFQNVMRMGFVVTIILLTILIVLSLLIWLFRSQKEIWNSNKIWDKEFHNNFSINFDCTNNTSMD